MEKKAPASKAKRSKSDGLQAEYTFDYSKAKPNRFAARAANGGIVVALDPDVSKVFTTSDAVNNVLRALIGAMPATASEKVR